MVDDYSTDDTKKVALNYMIKQSNKNTDIHSKFNMKILLNYENKGVSYAVNKGIDNAKGEYIVLLGADDYFYAGKIDELIDLIDGTDLIYFDLEINDGTIFHLCDETKYIYCGSVKLMRREFIGDTRNNESKRAGEDLYFFNELMDKNSTEKFSDIVAKHYDYPREGSLSYKRINGEFDAEQI